MLATSNLPNLQLLQKQDARLQRRTTRTHIEANFREYFLICKYSSIVRIAQFIYLLLNTSVIINAKLLLLSVSLICNRIKQSF